ncbi:FAD-binding oxidoreductase [Streptomyces parvus]|uniref:FAD-binding oxidoreductase n=1 Tax=Streptomyces parvus TaxID=66428 RepID=UPI0036829C56
MAISSTVPEESDFAQPNAIDDALQAAAGIVGIDGVSVESVDASDVDSSSGRENVGMYRSRRLRGVVRPATVEQVAKVVKVFGSARTECGLHAISTGRNWGLGSREPAHDNAVTLDLGALNRIRSLDLDMGWAVVEPGVTQGRLAERLGGTTRMLNVTASSAHTSVIGNGVDRGVGLRRQRVEDLVGLEVVLPDGELIHVGWWPESNRSTPVYPHGLGPSLIHLFTQSNLGIVTAAAVRLLPRPEAQRILRLSFGKENLALAIDEMRRWSAQGLVGGVLKVYDLVSAEFYGGRVGEFLAHICVDGTQGSVDAIAEAIKAEATRSGLFSQVVMGERGQGSQDIVARMVECAYAGDPGSNDAMLEATLGYPAESVDEKGLGWLFFLPLVPFSGESISKAHGLLQDISAETGARAGCTVNALSSDVIDFVVSIKFQRNEIESRRAHRALDLAYELFSDAGFIPYRLDVDHAEWMDRLSPDPGARALVRRLKAFMDPDSVIAPGRYA